MDTFNVDRTGSHPSRPSDQTVGSDVSGQIKLLQDDIGQLVTTIGELTKETVATATTEAQRAAGQTTERYETMVRNNPTRAALAAAGVGFVLGLLLTR